MGYGGSLGLDFLNILNVKGSKAFSSQGGRSRGCLGLSSKEKCYCGAYKDIMQKL